MPALAAALFQQEHLFDYHPAVDSFGHIVNSQGSYGGSGHSFHFHSRFPGSFDLGMNYYPIIICIKTKADVHGGQHEGMAHGYQAGGLLGGHNTCHLGNG